MDNLDKNILIRQPIRRNKYRNVSIFLFCFFLSIVATGISYTSLNNGIEKFYYYNYSMVLFSNTTEILFIAELTLHMQNKFSILNNNLNAKATTTKKFPSSIAHVSQKTNGITATKIVKAMETHHHLLMISKEFNQAFSFPIIVTIALNFQTATTSLYYTLSLTPHSTTIDSAIQLSSSYIWAGIMLFEIFIISKCFDNIADKV